MKKLLVVALLALVWSASYSATIFKVSPNPTNKAALTRVTQPDDGKANVGDPCEPEIISIVGKNEWHALKGTSPPHVRLAPCVPVFVPDPPVVIPPVVIPPVVVPPVVTPPVAGDFATRCAAPGVIKCVGFDAAADLSGGTNFGILPGPVIDTSVKASGASSIKFTVPSNSGAGASGLYYTNFSADLLTQFGEKAAFFVQWRQRFSAEFLNTVYVPPAGGWKQVIIGSGDQPGKQYFSCTDLEVVVQNTYQRGFAQMYNSCSGSATHGPFFGFEQPYSASDFLLQNEMPVPLCLYSSNAGCFKYFPNEWMTFQVGIKTGPRVGDEWKDSVVSLWIAREGQPSKLAIRYTINLSAGDPLLDQKFGKVWLLPYHTNKNALQVHPEGYVWYDELIISNSKIADPGAPTEVPVVPDPLPPVVVLPVEPPVVPTSQSLASLVAVMKPNTWAQLVVPNQNAVLSDVGVSGSCIGYSNSMPWNPVSKVIEIMCGDHRGEVPSLHHVRYDPATNQFVLVQAAPAVPGIGHGYDHNTLNPYTGDFYTRLYGGGGIVSNLSVLKKTPGALSFTPIPILGGQPYQQVAIGATWWSGSFAGAGAQGALIIFNSGNALGNANDGQIVAYNPLTNAWFFNKEGMAPNYGSGSTYHSVIEYSAKKNVAVYGGGNAAPSRLWRLAGDGSAIAMPNVPAGKSVGIQQGVFVDEPVTGNFLLLSAGELWELDPNGPGFWTQLASPPAGVSRLSGTVLAPIAVALPEHGVVAFISQPSSTGGTFYLYKRQ